MSEKSKIFASIEEAKNAAIAYFGIKKVFRIKEESDLKVGPVAISLSDDGRKWSPLLMQLPVPYKIIKEIEDWTKEQHGFCVEVELMSGIEERRFVVAPEEDGYAVWIYQSLPKGCCQNGYFTVAARVFRL